jgi:hypothetical protein
MKVTLGVAALAALASAAPLSVNERVPSTTTTVKVKLEIAPNEVIEVTEAEKWSMKAVGELCDPVEILSMPFHD